MISTVHAEDSSISDALSAINRYLDYRSISIDEREPLLHVLFELRQATKNGRFNETSRAELLAAPNTVLSQGTVTAVKKLSQNSVSASLRYPNDELGWLMLIRENGSWSIIFALQMAVIEEQQDGVFETGERTDVIREVVGKFYLHVATGNTKLLSSLLVKNWAEIFHNEAEYSWQTRGRNEYLDYLLRRDGISRIASGKKISAIEFIRQDMVRVTVQADNDRFEQLALVADGESWQVAYYLH